MELAQRSPSPGINNPTTALYCIDRLGQIPNRLASPGIPSPKRLDGNGHLCLLTETAALEDATCRPFAAIAR